MGEFATTVQHYLRDHLAERNPELDWATEYSIAGTSVDIVGEHDSRLFLLELEWRRADPVDNTAKLFRHLATGNIEKSAVVYQVFSGYYDLQHGGISSRRKDAEFVGNVAADTIDGLSYVPLDFELNPPKRGAERPECWEAIADDVVTTVSRRISNEASASSSPDW